MGKHLFNMFKAVKLWVQSLALQKQSKTENNKQNERGACETSQWVKVCYVTELSLIPGIHKATELSSDF